MITGVVTAVVMHGQGVRAEPWSEWCVVSGALLVAQEENQ